MKIKHTCLGQLLQIEGTEVGRNFDKDIWVKYLENWIKVHNNRGIDIFIISDLRFKNEYNFVKNNKGLMLKVIAPLRNEFRLQKESKGDYNLYEKISKHISECDLDVNYNYDMVIMNDITDNVNLNELQYKFQKLLCK